MIKDKRTLDIVNELRPDMTACQQQIFILLRLNKSYEKISQRDVLSATIAPCAVGLPLD